MAYGKQSKESALHNYRNSIKWVLFSERNAYGFTLILSGSALFTVNKYGVPSAGQVFVFVLGSLTAFAVLIVFSLGHFGRPVEIGIEAAVPPWGFLHLFSVLGALGAAYLAVLYSPQVIGSGVVSGSATLVYHLLLGLKYSLAARKT